MMTWSLPFGMLVASVLGSAICLFGRTAAGKKSSTWMDALYPIAAAFFIGFLVTTLVPHLFEAPLLLLPAFLVGYLVMALWSRQVAHHDPCCEVGHDPKPLGTASAIAMAICSLNDGLLLGLLAPQWLSGVNLGMILHKVTSSFALAQLLSQSSRTRQTVWIWTLGYAFVSPVTFYLGHSGLLVEGRWLGIALGFSAGILSYSIWTGMIPHSRRILKEKPMALIGFVGALAVSLALGFFHSSLHQH
jgi:zinc transporter ZupT